MHKALQLLANVFAASHHFLLLPVTTSSLCLPPTANMSAAATAAAAAAATVSVSVAAAPLPQFPTRSPPPFPGTAASTAENL
jgi:hypothetical protein